MRRKQECKHHEAPKASSHPRVITVDNQLDDYPNKSLCGGGICWQFCRAYDENFGYSYADDYIDLCALALVADMMDCRNIETRALIQEGLKNISNPFFKYMTEKNAFSMNKKGGNTHNGVAWYVAPFINATVRTGTQEEKELVFKSMCEKYAYDMVENGSRRAAFGSKVPLYQEAARVVGNIKTRQNKLQDESMSFMDRKIKNENLLDNAVLILQCEPGDVEKNVAGLVANKLQAKYQRPAMVLIKTKTKDDKEYFYRGSMRNYAMSEISNFKDILEGTGCVEWVQGRNGGPYTPFPFINGVNYKMTL